jgi:hypothetical protein
VRIARQNEEKKMRHECERYLYKKRIPNLVPGYIFAVSEQGSEHFLNGSEVNIAI